MAAKIEQQNLTAVQAERLIKEASPKKLKIGRGITARQRRFSTPKADVLMTFRKTDISHEDITIVLESIREQLSS